MFRLLLLFLLLLLAGMQYRLWVGEGGWAEVARLHGEIEAIKADNASLRTRNQALEAEIMSLKTGVEAMEERARNDLGMVKRKEDFFLIVEPQDEQQRNQARSSSPAEE